QIAQRIVLQLPLAILLKRSRAIERSAGRYARIVRSESALHLNPVRSLHIFPKDALQTLASGCFGQGARRMLAVKGTGRNQHHRNRNEERCQGESRTHGVIVPWLCRYLWGGGALSRPSAAWLRLRTK